MQRAPDRDGRALKIAPVAEWQVPEREGAIAAVPTGAPRSAAHDQLETFGVADVANSFCWDSPFASRRPVGNAPQTRCSR